MQCLQCVFYCLLKGGSSAGAPGARPPCLNIFENLDSITRINVTVIKLIEIQGHVVELSSNCNDMYHWKYASWLSLYNVTMWFVSNESALYIQLIN